MLISEAALAQGEAPFEFNALHIACAAWVTVALCVWLVAALPLLPLLFLFFLPTAIYLLAYGLSELLVPWLLHGFPMGESALGWSLPGLSRIGAVQQALKEMEPYQTQLNTLTRKARLSVVLFALMLAASLASVYQDGAGDYWEKHSQLLSVFSFSLPELRVAFVWPSLPALPQITFAISLGVFSLEKLLAIFAAMYARVRTAGRKQAIAIRHLQHAPFLFNYSLIHMREVWAERVRARKAAAAAKLTHGDRKEALGQVQSNGLILEKVSGALQNDKEVVSAAVQQNVDALQFASSALRKDATFMIELVKNLRCVSTRTCALKWGKNLTHLNLRKVPGLDDYHFEQMGKALLDEEGTCKLAAVDCDDFALQAKDKSFVLKPDLGRSAALLLAGLIKNHAALLHIKDSSGFKLLPVQLLKSAASVNLASKELGPAAGYVIAGLLQCNGSLTKLEYVFAQPSAAPVPTAERTTMQPRHSAPEHKPHYMITPVPLASAITPCLLSLQFARELARRRCRRHCGFRLQKAADRHALRHPAWADGHKLLESRS